MKNIKTFLTFVVATGLCIGSAMAAQTLGERHPGGLPQSTDGFAVKKTCMQCHGDYKTLAAKTKNLEPNPHFSHMGEVNCVECHKADKVKPESMCNSCHKFTFKPVK